MKIVMFGGALAILAGGVYTYKDRLITAPNVYAAPAEKVFAALDGIEIEPSGTGPMGRLDVTKSSEAPKSVTWSGSGSHAALICVAQVVPLGADRTRVDTNCGGGGAGEGAAGGMLARLTTIAMTEQVDSTLRGRPYDKKKVEMASAGAVLQGLPRMQADALKMDYDMHKMEAEARQHEAAGQP